MFFEDQWRVLTVGDGDLSFSRALLEYCSPANLTATVFDSPQEIERKYGLAHYNYLHSAGVEVETHVDITNPATFSHLGCNYDFIIFQFPLLPNFQTHAAFNARLQGADVNTLNRWLLHLFLVNSGRYLLDEAGQNLCCITSKDVKPYCDWNLELGITQSTPFTFLGQTEFKVSQFCGYTVRNVDRPGEVKDTASYSYYYSMTDNASVRQRLLQSDKLKPHHCRLCGAGPFKDQKSQEQHVSGKRHGRAAFYERLWHEFLSKMYETK